MEAWLASKPPGWLERWLAFERIEAEERDQAAGDHGPGRGPEMLSPEQAAMQMRMGFGVG